MKEFKDLEFTRTDYGGIEAFLVFDNNYGISVIMGPYSKGGMAGKYEIAILKMPPGQTFSVIAYDTPLANDVIGHLTKEEVADYIAKIQELPKIE